MNTSDSTMRPRRVGIDTHQENVVYMRSDCSVCRSEGFSAQARIEVSIDDRSILATLNGVEGDWLAPDEFGLSEPAWKSLAPRTGERARFAHAPPVESVRFVRSKIYGHRLDDLQLEQIVVDISHGRYTDIELAAFIAACGGEQLNPDEIVGLTRAMINAGETLEWPYDRVVDKHCVGGLPGNRTTPIVVAIVASFGLIMPKTSSRAITSPAGTADTMEVLAPVDLSLTEMQRVVERENGCVVWGGAVNLSPADDMLIRVERALDIDGEGQLVASVLSKKVAAGSTDIVIDIPVGGTAKVRSQTDATRLAALLAFTAERIGARLKCVQTDGSQPVGRGIGPVLEAHDVLAVLQNTPDAPGDLRARACHLAGELLELGGKAELGKGAERAADALDTGRAWIKFQAICEAQGGMRTPASAALRREIPATRGGRIIAVDNRRLARLAKLAGAPAAPTAGVYLHCRIGDPVERGQALLDLHAQSRGELDYALSYLESTAPIFSIEAHPDD